MGKASRRYLPRVARAEPLRASPAPQHGVKSCGHRRHGPGHNVRRPAASPLAILSPRLCAHRSSRDETIEGTVFTHDSTAGVVVIEQKGAGDKSTYRMLRSSAVKGLEVLAEPADQSQWAAAGGNEAELPVVDLEVTRTRTRVTRTLSLTVSRTLTLTLTLTPPSRPCKRGTRRRSRRVRMTSSISGMG